VLPGFDPRNFGQRRSSRVARETGLGHHVPKDLRDTFASWLLSLGVSLPHVSRQLGHTDMAVTARHYGNGSRETPTGSPYRSSRARCRIFSRGGGAEDAAGPVGSTHLHGAVSEAVGSEGGNLRTSEGLAAGGACRARTCDLRGVNVPDSPRSRPRPGNAQPRPRAWTASARHRAAQVGTYRRSSRSGSGNAGPRAWGAGCKIGASWRCCSCRPSNRLGASSSPRARRPSARFAGGRASTATTPPRAARSIRRPSKIPISNR
jgi:hypothetical protein